MNKKKEEKNFKLKKSTLLLFQVEQLSDIMKCEHIQYKAKSVVTNPITPCYMKKSLNESGNICVLVVVRLARDLFPIFVQSIINKILYIFKCSILPQQGGAAARALSASCFLGTLFRRIHSDKCFSTIEISSLLQSIFGLATLLFPEDPSF